MSDTTDSLPGLLWQLETNSEGVIYLEFIKPFKKVLLGNLIKKLAAFGLMETSSVLLHNTDQQGIKQVITTVQHQMVDKIKELD